MKKHLFSRFLLGFAMGNLICLIVNMIISACIGDGTYYAVMPVLLAHCGTELRAAAVQALMMGIIGASFAESTLVFEMEGWSFFKKCLLQFLLTAAIYAPFVWICYLPHHFGTVMIMAANFLFTYLLTWFLQYQANKRAVKEINQRIEEVRNNDGH